MPEIVEAAVEPALTEPAVLDGVRIAGELWLSDGVRAGTFNTLNGDKIYPLPPRRRAAGPVELRLRYRLGGGLAEFDARWGAGTE
ncbi:hypothetical protein [Micromonospora sp. NPDC049679]|uniref:hypothetical protein n=1 Tax=Micromonospora sp. NPDC049679 TaxID=3155920 RepID=UPI0033E32967